MKRFKLLCSIHYFPSVNIKFIRKSYHSCGTSSVYGCFCESVCVGVCEYGFMFQFCVMFFAQHDWIFIVSHTPLSLAITRLLSSAYYFRILCFMPSFPPE